MKDKSLQRVLNNISVDVTDVFNWLERKIDELESEIDILESKIESIEKQHEQCLKESFEKGYEEGVKYTDGLISSERFPF